MRNNHDNLPALRNYIKSLRYIPGGTFSMGSTTGNSDEKPVHTVQISAFRLGITPVTVAIWKEFCLATGVDMPQAPPWGWIDDHPIVNVSWINVVGYEDGDRSFCSWATAKLGVRLKLPSEAQFEYASRAGQSGSEYPWGNTFDHSKLWSSKIGFEDASRTAPVSRTSNIYTNAFGLSDMCGNVRHLCSDLYVGYKSSTQVNPMSLPSSESDNTFCVRGGSWRSMNPDSFRSANRFAMFEGNRDNYTGFRLAAGVP